MDFAGRMHNFGCGANEKRWQLCLEKTEGQRQNECLRPEKAKHKRVAITKLHRRHGRI